MRGTYAVIRVLLADDDALLRAGVAVVLGTAEGIVVVGEAADGLRAVELCRALAPDVVVMDVRMPGIDGIEATRRIVAAGLASRVLVLTTFQHDEYVWGALQAGASGFLLKRASPERLIDAVHTLAAGDALLDPAVTRDLVARFVAPAGRPAAAPQEPRLAGLTSRERHVLHLVAEGVHQRRDRGPADPGGVDGEDAREADPGEDRRAGPGAGRRRRLPGRVDVPRRG